MNHPRLKDKLPFDKTYTGPQDNYLALRQLGELLRSNGYTISCISGGFDPLHFGHLKLMEEATQFGALIALVNYDEFLIRKKGYVFQGQEERLVLVSSIVHVDYAFIYEDPTQYVAEGIRALQPTYFCNGGDRLELSQIALPEVEACREVGTELIFCGGPKVQSSSALIRKSNDRRATEPTN